MRRADRDGEAFLRFFHTGGGRCTVRTVEPEHVRSLGDQSAHLSFGVETPEHDVQDARAFWIVEEPSVSWTPSRVTASEVVHVRFNVDRTAKRGYPTLVPVRKNLLRADKLLQNMSTLAQVQATLALIRKHKQYSASAVSAWQQGQADLAVSDPLGGSTRYLQRYLPGTILDVPAQTDYEFPAARVPADSLVAVLQAELRAVAARLVLPEYMLTSNAENANYASTLVAEAPAVKHFERLQRQLARAFGDGRYGGPRRCGALWRVLECAVHWGDLPREVLHRVALHVEPPSPVARDKDKETTRAEALNRAGVLSKATWAKWEGLDPDRERRQVGRENKVTKSPASRNSFTEIARAIQEECQPHKSGRYKGTKIGYDPGKHNANCRLTGTGKSGRVSRKPGQDPQAGKIQDKEKASPALPAQTLEQAQLISNQGVPIERGVTDVPGPNVTKWFARDLILQLKDRLDTRSSVAVPTDLSHFGNQAGNHMSYKWLAFGDPPRGRGTSTVVLGDLPLHKKQLGNLAFMFVPTIYCPDSNATDAATEYKSLAGGMSAFFGGKGAKYREAVLDKRGEIKSAIEAVARIGYAVAPYYDPPAFGEFGDKVVYRADNLAAFGLGRQLAWEFMDRIEPGSNNKARDKIKELLSVRDKDKLNKNVQELADKLEVLLNEKLGDDGRRVAGEIGAFRKLQPIPNAPPITLDSLTFTPEYGGFNYRSLAGRREVPVFASNDNTIAAADRILKQYRDEIKNKLTKDEFGTWREKKYEQWTTHGNGLPLAGQKK
jgi:hypothetical protein